MNDRPVYVFGSKRLGNGVDELGEILIKGFFRTLIKIEPLPQVMIFLNTGVELLANIEIIENVDLLQSQGVKILACGTCLDYFHLKEQVKVEYHSNMLDILTTISNAPKVVNF